MYEMATLTNLLYVLAYFISDMEENLSPNLGIGFPITFLKASFPDAIRPQRLLVPGHIQENA